MNYRFNIWPAFFLKPLLMLFLITRPGGSLLADDARMTNSGSSEEPWETERPGSRPNLIYPIFYGLALDGLGLAFLNSLDDDTTGFNGPSFHNFESAFTKGPHWDDDGWYWNYLTHPMAGSEFYLRARAQGCTPFGSLLFTTGFSVIWEFGIESWFERPSGQDLIVTPLIGSVIGEARFRAKRALLEKNTGFSKTLAAAVDPLQSIVELIGSGFGQDWREPAFRKASLKAGQSAPLFFMDLASNHGGFSLSIRCRISF